MRSKGSITEVDEELAAFEASLEKDFSLSSDEASKIKRDVALQTILTVGSRSFSHFLNVLERFVPPSLPPRRVLTLRPRYLPLVRTLSASSSARLELLGSVATYWRRNSQFHLIVIDKLLQYRLVDSADVVSWVFTADPRKDWSDLNTWAALNSVVRTVEGRVAGAKGRLEGVRNEEETKVVEKTEPVDPGASLFLFRISGPRDELTRMG